MGGVINSTKSTGGGFGNIISVLVLIVLAVVLVV